MKYFVILCSLCLLFACQNEKPDTTEEDTKVESTPGIPQKEGQRNRRGYPIGTIQEATQLLAGVKLKKGVLNKRMTEMIQTQANGKDILAIGKPLEKILPMFNRMDSITPLIVKGENVDFLSDGDLGKIEYREQNLLDALIDSLSYLNSLYDQVLLESDKKLMGVPQSE